MQGTQIWSLIWEDPTCYRAIKPRATTTEPTCCNYWSPGLEPVLCNKRSHCNEKPVQHNKEQAPAHCNYRKPMQSNEDSVKPKIDEVLKTKEPGARQMEVAISLGFVNQCSAAAKSLQSCPTLCNPIDSSPTGSSVPGILQARILEWVAISFSNAWKWKAKWSCSVVFDS